MDIYKDKEKKMRILLLRHGEPDYANDTLTEKGNQEAELLSRRMANYDITDFYDEPVGGGAALAGGVPGALLGRGSPAESYALGFTSQGLANAEKHG